MKFKLRGLRGFRRNRSSILSNIVLANLLKNFSKNFYLIRTDNVDAIFIIKFTHLFIEMVIWLSCLTVKQLSSLIISSLIIPLYVSLISGISNNRGNCDLASFFPCLCRMYVSLVIEVWFGLVGK